MDFTAETWRSSQWVSDNVTHTLGQGITLSVVSVFYSLVLWDLGLVITSSCGVMAAGVLRIISIYLSVGTAHAQP